MAGGALGPEEQAARMLRAQEAGLFYAFDICYNDDRLRLYIC